MEQRELQFDEPARESEPPFGTEPRKLVRREDPLTSHVAAHAVDSTKLERMVLGAIASFGSTGCISDEVRAKFPDASYSSITARYKALRDKGLIEIVGARPGKSSRPQRIMRATRKESGNGK